MGNKRKFNAEWYTNRYHQIKISVNREIANEFRERCNASGVSMSGVLSNCMREYLREEDEKEKKCGHEAV
jgi:hypothetical protein